MTRHHILDAAGQGMLAGSLQAVILTAWEIRLHEYLGQRILLVPAQRLTMLATAGVLAGAAGSAAMAWVLSRLKARKAVWSAVAAFGVVGLALVACAVVYGKGWIFPSPTPRDVPLSAPSSIAALGAAALVALALFAARVAEGLTSPARNRRYDRLRRASSRAGFAALLLVLAANLVVPRFAANRAAGHPSVLLISIDTVRADRVGAYGRPRSVTPRLDRLASEGATFLHATSTAPWTMPAHASLFTSLLPFDHQGRWYRTPLSRGHTTLAERFRDAGYRTAAFTGGAWVHADRGFYQGFETYRSRNEIEDGGSHEIIAAAHDWLADVDAAPFFLFLHTYEAHTPYEHTRLANPRDAGRIGASFDYEDLERVRSGELVPTEEERRYIGDLYDGDLAEVDRVVGDFLRRLEQTGRLDDTIVVVTSDHGEDLWDHEFRRSPDHGHSLYEELLRVPLIIRAPGRVPAGTRIETPVSLIDVAPTVLSLADLPQDPRHQGVDLADSLRRGREPPVRPVFAESVEYGPDRFSAREGDLKVIVTPVPNRYHGHVPLSVAPLEIFDLATDPGERVNLAARLDPPRGELVDLTVSRARLVSGVAEAPIEDRDDPLSAEALEQLRGLGYVD